VTRDSHGPEPTTAAGDSALPGGGRPSRYDFSTRGVTFDSGGTACSGRLYLPDRPTDPPVVVMAHGFGAEQSFGLPRFAERFAEAGLAAFTFDYRDFGDSEGEPRGLVSPGRQVADYRAAVDRVRRLPAVDGARPILWGTSLSGGHVLKVAAADARIRAVVAQVPMVDGRVYLRSRSPGYLLRATAAGIRDRLQSPLFGPHEVPVVGDSDDVAGIVEPGAKRAYLDLLPPEADWENTMPARSLLALPRYRPIADAGDVACPTLFLAGDRDDLIPVDRVDAAADAVPESTFVRLPVGHFDVYDGPGFESAVGHEVTFLRSVL